jgi:hydroxymethylpyrimidine/phosphomethylpyrimidine kinase
MLGSRGVVEAVAAFLAARHLPNVVLDPVIRSSSGAMLQDGPGLELLRSALIPLCDVITPNVDEAAILVGADLLPAGSPWDKALPQIRRMAAGLHQLGARSVVITGGHLQPANDYLCYRSYESLGRPQEEILPGERLESKSTHGTGCAFATAVACQLARGQELPPAARAAKEYVRKAILAAYPLGKGIGPLNHMG